jgi:hypothetical protein
MPCCDRYHADWDTVPDGCDTYLVANRSGAWTDSSRQRAQSTYVKTPTSPPKRHNDISAEAA